MSTTATANAYYTAGELCDLLRITRRQLGDNIRRGRLPAPDVRLTPQLLRWKRSTIDAFLAAGGRQRREVAHAGD